MNLKAAPYPQNNLAFSVMAILLAGLLRFLSQPFETRDAFIARREHAYRVRAAVQNVERVVILKQQCHEVLAAWSGDARPFWQRRIGALWARIHTGVRYVKVIVRLAANPVYGAFQSAARFAFGIEPLMNGPPDTPDALSVQSPYRPALCGYRCLPCPERPVTHRLVVSQRFIALKFKEPVP